MQGLTQMIQIGGVGLPVTQEGDKLLDLSFLRFPNLSLVVIQEGWESHTKLLSMIQSTIAVSTAKHSQRIKLSYPISNTTPLLYRAIAYFLE